MNKKIIAITVCLIVVMAVVMTGCSQGVDKLFGKQSKIEYSLQTVQGLNVHDDAVMTSLDDFGLATFKYYNAGEDKTYYSLFNFETGNMIINNSTLPIIGIYDGLYAQLNLESKYILYGVEGMIASELEGSISDGCFYDKNNDVRYYIGIDGKLKKTTSPFEEIVRYNDVFELGDYKARAVASANGFGFKFYNAKGNFVGEFYPVTDLELSSSADNSAIWTIDNKIFLQYTTPSYADDDKFDLFIGGEKYDLTTYCYDVKSGKSKKVNFKYYVFGVYNQFDNGVILTVADIVDKSLTAQYAQAFGLDSVGNIDVKVDLQKLLKGTTTVSVRYGADGKEQLLLSNGTDTCLYEGNKCLVSLSDSMDATIRNDTVKINDRIYTTQGKQIIDASQVNSYVYTISGQIAYSMQDKDDTLKTRYFIYDISEDSAREIVPGVDESVTFASVYYKVGTKVYFYALQGEAIDNVQSIELVNIYSVDLSSSKRIYKVTTTDGKVAYYTFNVCEK
ncbi:MAG: hypothetical protein ACI4MI_00575 [Christensenellales bacterium]